MQSDLFEIAFKAILFLFLIFCLFSTAPIFAGVLDTMVTTERIPLDGTRNAATCIVSTNYAEIKEEFMLIKMSIHYMPYYFLLALWMFNYT